MNISAEITKDRKGVQTGLVVTVDKKKHKSDITDPSVLVSVEGKSVTMLGFSDVGGASEHINQLMRSIKKQPARHLGSPEHLFAFELRDTEMTLGAALDASAEARKQYGQQEEIARAFRANLNKNK